MLTSVAYWNVRETEKIPRDLKIKRLAKKYMKISSKRSLARLLTFSGPASVDELFQNTDTSLPFPGAVSLYRWATSLTKKDSLEGGHDLTVASLCELGYLEVFHYQEKIYPPRVRQAETAWLQNFESTIT